VEICKQIDRVLLGLQIYLSEVENEGLECLRLETLLSELHLVSLYNLFSQYHLLHHLLPP
jgi:hypothetical protein